MKILLIIALACLSTEHVKSQAIIGNSYVTIADAIPVYGLNKDGNIETNNKFKIKKGTKFSVNGFDKSNNIKITFWTFKERKKTKKGKETTNEENEDKIIHINELTKQEAADYTSKLEYISAWANYMEFVIEPTVFANISKLYFGKQLEFNWGVMTLPLKVRFGNGKDTLDKNNRFLNVEENLNLGFVSGLRQQLQGKVERSINYLVGIGLTNVNLDSTSLNSKANLINNRSIALSINGGCLYQFDSFQLGLFFGADYIPKNLGRDWKYQGKPWLGFAVGVSLFSRQSTQVGNIGFQ